MSPPSTDPELVSTDTDTWSERGQWWVAFLGARRDPKAQWEWQPPNAAEERGIRGWGRPRRLVLTSNGTVLDCLLVEPGDTATADQPPVVVLPFYDVESLWGLSNRRTARLSAEERRAKAYGRHLVESGLAVLLVPWWCEVEAANSGEMARDLEGRYSAPAVRHRDNGHGTGLGRAVGDVMAAVDALSELCPGRTLGAFGHSLGGKIVLGLAALDDRISAAVIHEPGLGWQHSNWEAPWYLDASPPTEPDLDELLMLIGPRPCLYVGGGGFDGPDNEPLARSAQQAPNGQNLEIQYHQAGHAPSPEVLQNCYVWLHSHLVAGR